MRIISAYHLKHRKDLHMIGIYCITNITNEKKYIGQSKDISKRFIQHKSSLKHKTHANRHLQSAWNKYGCDNFTFTILEECAEEQLNEKEQYWIDYYDSDKNGYNLNAGGDGVRGYKHSKEEIEKMRKIQSPLPILQFDLNFNFIGYYIGGICHAAKESHYTRSSIENRCKHKSKIIPYKNCYWIYEDEYLHPDFSWKLFLNNQSCYTPLKKTTPTYTQQKICQYTLDRKLVKIWNTYKELEDAGYTRTAVNMICNHRKNLKVHKGFLWAYEGYDFSDGYFDTLTKKVNQGIERRKRSVLQYDKNGVLVHKFPSVTEASKFVNGHSSMIAKACKYHRVSKNFFWAYEDDDWIQKCPEQLHILFEKHQQCKKKEVDQYDENHLYIMTYESMSDAARKVNTSVGNISRAISNGGKCRNSYWKYKENN